MTDTEVTDLSCISSDREVAHTLAVPENSASEENRPLREERIPQMKEFHSIMMKLLGERVEECKDLPSRQQILESDNHGKDANGAQSPWKWTEGEVKEATAWIDDPVNRVRFLRARQWNYEPASELMINAIQWRRTFQGIGVPRLTVKDAESQMRIGKAYPHGLDKHSRPVTYVVSKLHESGGDQDEIQKFCVYFMEQVKRRCPKGITRICVVFDLGGFALRNMDYQFTKFMIHMLQNYYPDTLGVAYILNSPWLFSGCWAVLKRWIDPVSQKKVNFINMDELPQHIDAEQLPTMFGGTTWEFNPDAIIDEHAASDQASSS